MDTSDLRQLQLLSEKRNQSNVEFNKHLLLTASAVFGLLATLHKSPEPCGIVRNCYLLAVLLLSLGILALSIAAYVQVIVDKRMFLAWKEELLLRIRNENYEPKKLISGNPPKIFRLCEVVGQFSLIIAFVVLTVYAIINA